MAGTNGPLVVVVLHRTMVRKAFAAVDRKTTADLCLVWRALSPCVEAPRWRTNQVRVGVIGNLK